MASAKVQLVGMRSLTGSGLCSADFRTAWCSRTRTVLPGAPPPPPRPPARPAPLGLAPDPPTYVYSRRRMCLPHAPVSRAPFQDFTVLTPCRAEALANSVNAPGQSLPVRMASTCWYYFALIHRER